MSQIVKQGSPGALGQGWNTRPDQLPTVGATFNSKSKVNDAVTTLTYGCPSVTAIFNMIGANTSLVVTFEVSDNGADWSVGYSYLFANATAGQSIGNQSGTYALGSGPQVVGITIPTMGLGYCRVRISTASAGSGSTIVRLTPSTASAYTAVQLVVSGATINTNTIGISGLNTQATTLAIQASQTSGVANATTTRTTTTGLGVYKSLNFLLNITGAGAATGVLQVFCEDSQDGGTTWDDLWASNTFTFGAAVTTQRFFVQGAVASSITSGTAQAIETLAAGTMRQGPFGDRVRIREVVSGISGGPTGVTYRVDAIPHL